MASEEEREQFPNLTANEIDSAKELYMKGYSRDRISRQLNIGHSTSQKLINYFKTTNLSVKHEESIKEKGRKEFNPDRETMANILQEYRLGTGINEIRDKYGGSREFYMELVKQYPEEIINEHYENIEKNRKMESAELSKKRRRVMSVKQFFGRDIEHLNADIYCRLVLKQSIKPYEHYEEIKLRSLYNRRQLDEPTTILTFKIISKSDVQRLYDSKILNANNINEEASFCIDFRTKNTFTIDEVISASGI